MNFHRFEGETQPGLVACKDAAKRLIDNGLAFTSRPKISTFSLPYIIFLYLNKFTSGS